MHNQPAIDPQLDLVFERTVDLPPALVWRAWTEPELLMQWFTPAPWKTIECEIDLRPGGKFRTVMQSPEGETMPPGNGCYLEVVEERRLTFTDALQPGFRPAPEAFFTGTILLEPAAGGTRYTGIAMHATKEAREKHEAMGFHEGWGKALDQLVALMR
ncbi:MAG: SRPBCC family protein [Planctomycetota bacterium]